MDFSAYNTTRAIKCLFLTYSTSKPTKVSYGITIATCVLTGILSLTGATANSLVCIAILKNRELQIRSNILLLVLSFNDLLVAITTEPLYILRRALESSELYLCWVSLAYRTMWNVSIGLSFLVVTLISCERFIALFYPFWYIQYITVGKLALSSLFCSVAWILLTVSRFFGLDTILFYYICSALVLLFILVISLTHAKIFKLARHHQIQISLTSISTSSDRDCRAKKRIGRPSHTDREAKIARSTACIVGAVFLCYMPLVVSMMTMIVLEEESLFYYYVFPWTDFLVFLNSLLNPLIYCWRSRNLRAAIFRFLCRIKKPHRNNRKGNVTNKK